MPPRYRSKMGKEAQKKKMAFTEYQTWLLRKALDRHFPPELRDKIMNYFLALPK